PGAGNASLAAFYAQHCAGCHGTDLAGGRVRSLFDEQWLAKTDDDRLIRTIRDGLPGTEMPAFGSVFSEQQTWQLVQHIRSRAGSLAPKPAFVADPHGRVITTRGMTLRV